MHLKTLFKKGKVYNIVVAIDIVCLQYFRNCMLVYLLIFFYIDVDVAAVLHRYYQNNTFFNSADKLLQAERARNSGTPYIHFACAKT